MRSRKRFSFAGLLVGVAIVGGCDFAKRDFSADRADTGYRSAMADYAAGRMDAALKGLKAVVEKAPANASARFQLACLEQDHAKDYLAAICDFREYIALAPKSDKSSIAQERMDRCLHLFAPVLARKMNIADSETLASEVAKLGGELAAAKNEIARMKKEADKLEAEFNSSRAENDRLRRLVASVETEELTVVNRSKSVSDHDLLNDEGHSSMADAKAVAKLLDDESEETATPFAPSQPKEKAVKEAEEKLQHPDSYIVQEGDTLYQLAMRFYGRRSAWKSILEANKTTVSSDGRIKAGQKLILPQ